jgi:hypothetical protein
MSGFCSIPYEVAGASRRLANAAVLLRLEIRYASQTKQIRDVVISAMAWLIPPYL